MSFGTIQFTNKGRILQAKAQTGVQLVFSRIGVGDGSLSGQAIDDLTDLIHEILSVDITRLNTMPGGKAKVGGTFSNQDLVSGFWWREVGLYATDPDVGEILYCYGNAGALAEYIPSPGGAEIIEKQVDIIAMIGNAANVSAEIDQSLVYIEKSIATAADQVLVSDGLGSWTIKTKTQFKTWLALVAADISDFAATVRTTVLAGLSTASSAAITAADSVLGALGKLQAQITTHSADITAHKAYYTNTAGTDDYTITIPGITSWADLVGVPLLVKFTVANTTGATLNVNGLGAKTINKFVGTGLESGDIPTNAICQVVYDGTNVQLLSILAATVTWNSTSTLTNKTATALKITSGSHIADSNGNELIKFPAAVASAINEVYISNAAAGVAPVIAVTGGDTDINVGIQGKGTGDVFLSNHKTNCIKVAGAGAGGAVSISAIGGDATIPLTIVSKGGGIISQWVNNVLSFAVDAVAASVNYLKVKANIAGQAPTLEAIGTDNNIDVNIIPKGTGKLKVGGAAVVTTAKEAYIDATPGNGWTGTIQYSKDDLGNVTLYINAIAGTVAINTAIATVPVGYRPKGYMGIATINNTTGSADIGIVLWADGRLAVGGSKNFIATESVVAVVTYRADN